MYYSFLIHSSADGHLGCFRVLAIINGAAMNIGVQLSLNDCMLEIVTFLPVLIEKLFKAFILEP